MHCVVERNECVDPDSSTIKNKWKWDWLTNKDFGVDIHGRPCEHYLSEYIVKINVDREAFCTWCNMTINYGSSGKIYAITQRGMPAILHVTDMSENSTLPVAYSRSENIIDKKTKSRLP